MYRTACKSPLASPGVSLLLRCSSTAHGGAAQPTPVDGEPAKPYSAIPGPRGWPIVGNALEMSRSKSLREFFYSGFMKYGDIYKLNAFGNRMVLIKDPESIADVLRAEGRYPVRDHQMGPGMTWLARNRAKQEPSFAFEDGKAWKTIRSAIGKQAVPRNVHTYSKTFNLIYDRFIQYIDTSQGVDGTIDDIVQPLKLLNVELSAKFVYDNDVIVVGNPSGEYKDFVNAIKDLFDVVGRVATGLPWYKLYNDKTSRKYTRSVNIINGVSRKEIEVLRSRLESGVQSETPGLMEHWLRDGKLSEEQIMVTASDMFTAGVDTTANQSAILLHQMATHPEVQERLYEEVLSVLGEGKEVTPQHLVQMPYMKGCILESFRR